MPLTPMPVRWIISLCAGIMLIASAAPRVHAGVRDFTERTIQGALEQRADQARAAGVEDNMGETKKQQRQGEATAQGQDDGWITRPGPDGKQVRLFVQHPFMKPGDKPHFPALIVIQEWWGVNRDIEQRTQEFAAKGYYAVAVDLYDGKHTDDPQQAAAFKRMLTDEAARSKLKVGLAYLMTLSGAGIIDPQRVGAIGWCMGGHAAIDLAVSDPRIKATVLYYGTPVTDEKQLANLKGPVLGIFGKADKSIPQAKVDDFEKGLTDAGIEHEILRYDDVGHAFASRPGANSPNYDAAAAKDANAKMIAWLNVNLKHETPTTQPGTP